MVGNSLLTIRSGQNIAHLGLRVIAQHLSRIHHSEEEYAGKY